LWDGLVGGWCGFVKSVLCHIQNKFLAGQQQQKQKDWQLL
jgi:hypothetical protein